MWYESSFQNDFLTKSKILQPDLPMWSNCYKILGHFKREYRLRYYTLCVWSNFLQGLLLFWEFCWLLVLLLSCVSFRETRVKSLHPMLWVNMYAIQSWDHPNTLPSAKNRSCVMSTCAQRFAMAKFKCLVVTGDMVNFGHTAKPLDFWNTSNPTHVSVHLQTNQKIWLAGRS